MPVLVMPHFVGDWWSRTNYAHLSAQHIYDLWQLINRIAPHPASNPGYSWIVLDLAVDRVVDCSLVCVLAVYGAPHQFAMRLIVNAVNHRSELDHQKNLAIHTDALLL